MSKRKRLGDNPLADLKKTKKSIKMPKRYLKKKSKKKEIKEIKKSSIDECIYLKKYNKKFFCTSRKARYHGLLGNIAEARKKCSSCYMREVK